MPLYCHKAILLKARSLKFFLYQTVNYIKHYEKHRATIFFSFMIKKLLPAFILATAATALASGNPETSSPKVLVDRQGVMRNTSDNSEVAYYGTNYTLPFAHAYRAVKKSGGDFHKIIDRDVYHFRRLGLNAFRLHLWDVEIADADGNLIDNEHLELLDYLIHALEKEGIDIIITAQTNFGNGYPEKNIDTGAYTYDFDKCNIHENPKAQKIQENYLRQLMQHVNRHTGKAYGADPDIIGVEINNEPCHSGSRQEVTAYIDRMSDALRAGGYKGVIMYNVSHNPEVTAAYYDAKDISATTYQWYPDGLVAGHERKGNLLPYVDEYIIPWRDTIPGFDRMARVVYEFDPGDVLTSYLYPAIARTFRKEGFQWATQFAYDPTPIAPFNTEYQTHYLNLLYTPSKALSMSVAAEVMKETPRGKDYGKFPADTLFGNFRLSPALDLSEYSTPETFIHTNTTSTSPKAPSKLKRIAGVGSSPIIKYHGSGAYFLDRIRPGVWRLEIMPDLVRTADPFEKPSPSRPVGWLDYKENPVAIELPSLGKDFRYLGIDSGNDRSGTAEGYVFPAYPGTYLLYQPKKEAEIKSLLAGQAADMLKRYAAPGPVEAPADAPAVGFLHTAPIHTPKGKTLRIYADAIPLKAEKIDSIVVYPSDISFWREDNPSFEMKKGDGNRYHADIPEYFTDRQCLEYNITVYTPDGAVTYPSAAAGMPLDWDYRDNSYYTVFPTGESDYVTLLTPSANDKSLDISTIPSTWTWRTYITPSDAQNRETLTIVNTPEEDGSLILSRYIADDLRGVSDADKRDRIIVSLSGEAPSDAQLNLVDADGITRGIPFSSATASKQGNITTLVFDVKDATPRARIIPTPPFPTFLLRETEQGTVTRNRTTMQETEFLQIIVPQKGGDTKTFAIQGIWLDRAL